MIAFANVSKQYGKQILFVDASFQLNPGEKVGLVGPNGAGKTTIFNLISGMFAVDAGRLLTVARYFGGSHSQLNMGLWRGDTAAALSADDLNHAFAAIAQQRGIDGDAGWQDQRLHLRQQFAQLQRLVVQLGRVMHRMPLRQPLHHIGFQRLDDQETHGWLSREEVSCNNRRKPI